MIVTDIITLDKKRDKIYIDNEFAFVLYKGELQLLGIMTGEPILQTTYEMIMDELLLKRAKLRAMNLLTKKDYTQKQLCKKLKEGYYTEGQIDKTIDFLKEYGYLDDARYVKNYFFTYIGTTPKNQIIRKLLEKGISQEMLDKMVDEIYKEESELTNIPSEEEIGIKLLEKKNYDILSSVKEKQKAYAYLLRKGIGSEIALKILKEYQKEKAST